MSRIANFARGLLPVLGCLFVALHGACAAPSPGLSQNDSNPSTQQAVAGDDPCNERNRRGPIYAAILDLDNTLWDWVELYTPAAIAMVDQVAAMLAQREADDEGTPAYEARVRAQKQSIVGDLHTFLQGHDDVEVPFALADIGAVVRAFPGLGREERIQQLQPAFATFNKIRSDFMTYNGLYGYNYQTQENPTLAALQRLSDDGVILVAQSDALAINALNRLRKFNLLKYFHWLYAVELKNSEHPDPETGAYFQSLLQGDQPRVVQVPPSERKPNPALLQDILRQINVSPEHALFVGDSLSKDVLMANQAGVFAVHAAYGLSYLAAPQWATYGPFLSAIRDYRSGDLKGTPDVILTTSVNDLFRFFDFAKPPPQRP